MRIRRISQWTIDADVEKTLKFNDSQEGDVVISEVYVQLTDGVDCEATGFLKDGGTAVALKFLDIGTYETKSKASDEGIYLIMAGSLEALNLSFDKTGDSNGKAIVKEVF